MEVIVTRENIYTLIKLQIYTKNTVVILFVNLSNLFGKYFSNTIEEYS